MSIETFDTEVDALLSTVAQTYAPESSKGVMMTPRSVKEDPTSMCDVLSPRTVKVGAPAANTGTAIAESNKLITINSILLNVIINFLFLK